MRWRKASGRPERMPGDRGLQYFGRCAEGCRRFCLGCPAMGAEVLEESEMDPFVAEVETFASGKHIGLFGSYGWGDGEWMRDWQARMANAGAT